MAKYFFDPERVIGTARAEIGYVEKKSAKELDDKTANAGDKNYTKYARDLDAIKDFYNGRKQGICGWCDIFVDWCFVQAYGENEGRMLLCQPARSCGAGPYFSAQYFRSKKQFYTTGPQPGDQVFFLPADGGKISHTGLVTGVDAQYVYTIEGNTSAGNGHGGMVAEKKYAKNNPRIAGYGRPDWGEMPDDEPEEEPDENTGEENGAELRMMLHAGPGTEYDVVGTVESLDAIAAVALNGWIGIWYEDGIAWADAEDVAIVPVGGAYDE